jgi:uncharacterized protein YerC
MGIVPTDASDRQRFWKKVEKTSSCWLWTGARFSNGYAAFRLRGKQRKAHIVSFEWLKGPTFDLQVCHHCDVKHCVNPEHLFLGTQSDNIRDMFSKGRQRERRGEISNWAKLTENDVREIHALLLEGIQQQDIADHYGITQTAVSHIGLGTAWEHLSLPVLGHQGKPRPSPDTVRAIRTLVGKGVPYATIVDLFGYSKSTVSRIALRQAYADVE